MAGAPPDWDERLRAAGLRSTIQRRAVLQALFDAQHATVDELAVEVQRTRPDVNLSTIYRTLEALDEVGLVTHAHLHHGSPTYHTVELEPHLHLVCTQCGSIGEAPIGAAEALAEQLRDSEGFLADLAHLVVHGRCRACAEAAAGEGGIRTADRAGGRPGTAPGSTDPGSTDPGSTGTSRALAPL